MGHNSLDGWGWQGCLLGVGGLESGMREEQSLMVTVQGVDLGGRGWLGCGVSLTYGRLCHCP